jgi:hypothetical protein
MKINPFNSMPRFIFVGVIPDMTLNYLTLLSLVIMILFYFFSYFIIFHFGVNCILTRFVIMKKKVNPDVLTIIIILALLP